MTKTKLFRIGLIAVAIITALVIVLVISINIFYAPSSVSSSMENNITVTTIPKDNIDQTTTPSLQVKTYTNKFYPGFSFKYDDSWTLRENISDQGVYKPKPNDCELEKCDFVNYEISLIRGKAKLELKLYMMLMYDASGLNCSQTANYSKFSNQLVAVDYENNQRIYVDPNDVTFNTKTNTGITENQVDQEAMQRMKTLGWSGTSTDLDQTLSYKICIALIDKIDIGKSTLNNGTGFENYRLLSAKVDNLSDLSKQDKDDLDKIMASVTGLASY